MHLIGTSTPAEVRAKFVFAIMGFIEINIKKFIAFAAVAAFIVVPVLQTRAAARISAFEATPGGLGVITGYVRDQGGNPIADATVAIFRAGTSKLLKQVSSAANGRFIAKLIPGKYSVLAVAQGFNPVTLPNVEVGQASQLEYGFKLEKAGSGNTLPEKRLDRNNPKWSVRSSAISRSIYQNNGNAEAVVEETAAEPEPTDRKSNRDTQSVAATYYSSSERGSFQGFNFATLIPLKENADVMIAAQTGTGSGAPQRIDTELRFKPVEDHSIRVRSSVGKVGSITLGENTKQLGQISIQATDEWQVGDRFVVVYGFNFSRFIGGGSDQSLSPRLGLQFDLDAKTRFRAAYTTQNEVRSWSRAIELENVQIAFREPVSIDDVAFENGKALMNRSSRMEFGIERVLDNNSTIEANVFSDAVFGKGVSFIATPFDSSDGAFTKLAANQEGSARGVRFVYSRRLGSLLNASAGYSFGQGQRVSQDAFSEPDELFVNSFFQSLFGQLEADLKTGTNIKTIFRLSPEATVFAIDPFQGRLTIYDPGLSVFVTQNIPTPGLPFQAQAIVDARNLLDTRNGIFGEDGSFRLNSGGKSIRGGILVRF
ncbi:MAG: carboxypeptidase regulatory-like domain-containing protein [Pyrinomonadaceae bacterium]